eukprot:scaffold6193_cov123-Isochrysis_galbana.AAC.1
MLKQNIVFWVDGGAFVSRAWGPRRKNKILYSGMTVGRVLGGAHGLEERVRRRAAGGVRCENRPHPPLVVEPQKRDCAGQQRRSPAHDRLTAPSEQRQVEERNPDGPDHQQRARDGDRVCVFRHGDVAQQLERLGHVGPVHRGAIVYTEGDALPCSEDAR